MSIEEEVKKLKTILTPHIVEYFRIYDLNEIYSWGRIPYDEDILNNNEIAKLKRCENNFIRNVELKHIINNKLKNSNQGNELYKWIINKWGGINSFNSYYTIDTFLNNLEKNKLLQRSISSLSKIASFKYLNKYFIYDSRVSFTLNWLLLKHKNNNIKYFRVIPGKNDITKKYNMKKILKSINKNPSFFNTNEYYFIL